MLPAIEFNHQFFINAGKVCNVGADWMLTAKTAIA